MKPKIGLALGAGGARGLAHIGVLKSLKEHNIQIDYIAGSSMGSFIGAIYANQCNLDLLEKLAYHLKRKYWLDFTVPKLGFIAGERVKELIRILTHGKNIEQLSIPLAIVATDLASGERVTFREGRIDTAVRASIAIPGIFSPERWNEKYLVDGGVIDRVPVSVAREMGSDIVIAVDVAAKAASVEIHSILDVISRTIDIMEEEILKNRITDADFVIRPEVGHIPTMAFHGAEECIREGQKVAEQMIPQIKERIEEWRESNEPA